MKQHEKNILYLESKRNRATVRVAHLEEENKNLRREMDDLMQNRDDVLVSYGKRKLSGVFIQCRGTHQVFTENATSQYAWNSAPIDSTDIIRSVAAVGREFRFPLDVELLDIPTLLNDNNNTALMTCLWRKQAHLILTLKLMQSQSQR